MTNKQYYKSMTSHRLTVKVLVDIADVLLKYGAISWYKSCLTGTYNESLLDMVTEIKRLKKIEEKYVRLHSVVQELVS